MIVERAFVGARGIDSVQFSNSGTMVQAAVIRASGVEFVVGYLGSVTPARLAIVLTAGLAFMPVTYAGEFFDGGADEVAQLQALGLPAGCTVWLDLEGDKSAHWPADDLIAKINAWANAIKAAGYEPGLYVGSPQPLTGEELGKLQVQRYWKAPSRVQDRFGAFHDTPSLGPSKPIGFCMWQMWPQGVWHSSGVNVDVNIIGQDYRGRVPAWVRA